MKYRKHGLAAVLAVGALSIAACSGGGSGQSGSTAAPTGHDFSGQTLSVLVYENDTSAMGKAWRAAAKTFEQETGAKVDYQTTAFEDLSNTASQLFTSSDAPDLSEYNKGNGTAGALSTLGVLQNLDSYYSQYGWGDELAPSLQTTTMYSDKGIMGSGSHFGVPNYGEFVFLYYNKDMLDQYGMKPPTTMAELESEMQTFVDKGVTPLSTAAQEYPAGQLWYQLVLNNADRQFVNDYQLYDNPVDFTKDPIASGTQTLADWVSKGYVDKASTGMTAEDAGLAFINGKSPFFFSGSWWYGRFLTDIKDFTFGITDFPGSTLVPGSSGNLWVIPTVTDSQHSAMAAYFIDITMRPEIQAILGNAGGLPVAANPGDITDPKAQDLISLFNKVLDRDGLAFYPDWPTSTFYDDLNAGLQGLINGSLSVKQTEQQLQSDYDTGTAQYR
ncbi:extracellular solute-binding protein [Isoptericola sp. b490]|uniref:ABC transporter substrate-binding protein n=1 Tax=Actinotalea lenta TaxID=3064654 RepID=UPI0027126708|nr:extracellular solute-binding protein [Isoptericola sp. b490]MDO8119821.1 extracellular solute-binding protein [Isoptericola sp. b490]